MGWGLGSDGATALMGFGEGSGRHGAHGGSVRVRVEANAIYRL